MLSDFHAVVKKAYNIKPVSHSLIPSNHGTKQQILWVGCSCSLISETETLGVEPEEIFVHRNLGNILSNGDLSSASAVEWCLENLKVDHIVICGHYDCDMLHPTGTIGQQWYKDITKLHDIHERHLSTSAGMTDLDEVSREHRMEEIYVLAEVDWLKRQPNVQKAIQERGVQIHAFCYDKETNQCSEMIEKKVIEKTEEATEKPKEPWMQTVKQQVSASAS